MAERIHWAASLDEGRAQAAREQKPLLLYGWSPGCAGCTRMESVTYPDPRVWTALTHVLVAARLNLEAEAHLGRALGIVWTPTFQLRTHDDRLVRATTGYLSPEAFLADLAVWRAQVAMLEGRAADAEAALREAALKTTYSSIAISPVSESAESPEVLYWLGVARYKASGQVEGLYESWSELIDRFPQSAWASRASVAREGRD
jgi:tetratricopeptide (TPR) repeat protein